MFIPFMEDDYWLFPFSRVVWEEHARTEILGVSGTSVLQAKHLDRLRSMPHSAAAMAFGNLVGTAEICTPEDVAEAETWYWCSRASPGAYASCKEIIGALQQIGADDTNSALRAFLAPHANPEDCIQYRLANAKREWTIMESRTQGIRIIEGLRLYFRGQADKTEGRVRRLWSERVEEVNELGGMLREHDDMVLATLGYAADD